MNYSSCRAGICCDQYINKRVYVGGGRSNTKKFEYFDINKTQWIQLCDTNNSHTQWPVVWSENNNMIYIASRTSRSFEKMDLRQNKWTVYIENNIENAAFDNVFGANISGSCRMCL